MGDYDPKIRPRKRYVVDRRHEGEADPCWTGDEVDTAKKRARQFADKVGATYWVRDRQNDGEVVAVARPTPPESGGERDE